MLVAASSLPMQPRNSNEFVTHLSLPVAHSLMGKGVLPDDHPMTLGMTGFWGTAFINDKCKAADYILALGNAFLRSRLQFVGPALHLQFPAHAPHPYRHRPSEIGRNYPAEIGVVADLKQSLSVLNRVAKRLLPAGRKNAALIREIADESRSFCKEQRAASERRRVSDEAGAHSRGRARGASPRCDHYDRRRLE